MPAETVADSVRRPRVCPGRPGGFRASTADSLSKVPQESQNSRLAVGESTTRKAKHDGKAATLYNLADLHVLIVDDNAFMRVLVATVLHSFGVRRTDEACEGADALEKLEAGSYDLMITDLMMAPVDGITLTRMIRKSSGRVSPYLPIILMTGHTDKDHVFEARDVGVTEIIAKPIAPKALYERIVAIIEKPRPFVRAKGYTGPCRRRIQKDWYPNDLDRRSTDNAAQRADAKAKAG